MKKQLLLLLALACFSLPLWAADFTFTAIPDQNTDQLEQRFGKVAQYLEKTLGVKVRYIPVKSYAASVAAFKNNQVQLAWFGGLSGVQARQDVPGSLAIAQGEEDTQFKSYLIAHVSTGLQASETIPAGIKGKSFTFGSKGSTSGRLMPEFFIRQAFKEDPRKTFKRVGFSGDHSKTISLVQSGAYEVGAVNYVVWDSELAEGKIDPSKVKVIWTSPAYPDYNWTIRGDVENTYGKGFIQKVQKALLDIKDKELLDSFPRAKFIAADNQQYEPILATGREIGLLH